MKYEWLDGYLLSFPGAEKRWHPGWKMFLYEVRGKQFAAVCAPGGEVPDLRRPRAGQPEMRPPAVPAVPGGVPGGSAWILLR